MLLLESLYKSLYSNIVCIAVSGIADAIADQCYCCQRVCIIVSEYCCIIVSGSWRCYCESLYNLSVVLLESLYNCQWYCLRVCYCCQCYCLRVCYNLLLLESLYNCQWYCLRVCIIAYRVSIMSVVLLESLYIVSGIASVWQLLRVSGIAWESV